MTTSAMPDRLAAALADRYTIERELGRGGMATVYLAHDVRHDRKVAVKVLRPELAAVLGAERFVNEIKVTANLQHPHLLPLFDSGEADTFLFYVMPYVEGESLRARLDRERQLGVDEGVRIATEVAAALDYAHRQGVVHRDIKPANILLHDGSALVADFGIARALSKAGGDRLTETGLSLGTPHYMSPEQATGDRDVDARSDTYSLAAVLYEMLAGEPPHGGGTVQAIVSKVLTERPKPLGDLRHSVPAHVAMTVEKALEKIPADRFASTGEFAAALKDPQLTLSYMTAARRGAVAAAPWWRDWRAGAAGAALLALGLFAGSRMGRNAAETPLVARFLVPIEAGQGLTGAPVNTIAISPDGQSIVYVGRAGGAGFQLYLRRLDELNARPIPGTTSASYPIFSPDGSRLAFFGPGGFYQMPVAGGAPTTVPNVPAAALVQAVWLDERSFLATHAEGHLVRVGLDGSVTSVATPDSAAGELYLVVNSVLPDRRTVLALATSAAGVNGRVIAIDTETGRRTPVVDAVTNAVWYADRCLLWAQPGGAVLGARFDPEKLEITGPPVTLVEGVRLAVGGAAQIAVSATGSMLYVPEQPFNLMLVDRSGRRETIAEGRRFHSPRFSPDGRRVALDFTYQGTRDVWTIDLRQGTMSRLSFEDDGHDPVWFPDGRSVAYVSRNGIYRRRADGGGVAESVYVGAVLTSAVAFTADGRTAITAPTGANGGFDIGLLTLGEDRKERPLLATPFNEQYAALSPNGRWLAYGSDETGREEVYVRPWPEGGAKVLVSRDGGREPVWNPNGRELFYVGERDGVSTLMVATVSLSGDDFTVGSRVPLFDLSEFEPASPHANYDVSPDGTRFVLVHQGPLSEMVFVLNWTEEVRRRSAAQ